MSRVNSTAPRRRLFLAGANLAPFGLRVDIIDTAGRRLHVAQVGHDREPGALFYWFAVSFDGGTWFTFDVREWLEEWEKHRFGGIWQAAEVAHQDAILMRRRAEKLIRGKVTR